jgi:heat-inducible transcriptional repressor
MNPDSTLDDRKAAILRAVVQEYIETAQPVGSGHVVASPGVQVSSATVRNDMALLEQEGYLEQPHTSAGRVPTEKGYRFFVDSLEVEPALARSQRQQVSTFFSRAHGEIEHMLEDTTRLLSTLTDYAAVVVAPQPDHAEVRSVQVIGLHDRVGLLIVVLSTGGVEKHSFDLPEGLDEARLAAATVKLSEAYVGHTLERHPALLATGDGVLDALLARCVDLISDGDQADADSVFVGGTARMASAFDAVETVKDVLAILEQQLVVVSLLHDVLDRGLSVAIGTETRMQPLADCSVVVAPYQIDGETAGTIGVLGPTRMNYPQALAAVAVVSKRLGTHLSEG